MGFASWQRYCTASSSGRQPNFGALNRGRHLCLAGRPSRWALAHISSCLSFHMTLQNRVISAFSNISATVGMSSLLDASNLSRSTAEWKPDHDEAQYSSLASTVIVKTSFMDIRVDVEHAAYTTAARTSLANGRRPSFSH